MTEQLTLNDIPPQQKLSEPENRLPVGMSADELPHPDEDPDLQYYHPGKQWTLLVGSRETEWETRRITILDYDSSSVEGVEPYQYTKGFAWGETVVNDPEDRNHDGTVTVRVEETGGVGEMSAVGLRCHSAHMSRAGPINDDSYEEYYYNLQCE